MMEYYSDEAMKEQKAKLADVLFMIKRNKDYRTTTVHNGVVYYWPDRTANKYYTLVCQGGSGATTDIVCRLYEHTVNKQVITGEKLIQEQFLDTFDGLLSKMPEEERIVYGMLGLPDLWKFDKVKKRK